MKDPLVFLQHILESIEAIEKYNQKLSKRDFLKRQEKQDAVVRRLEVIGEAVRNIPEDFKNRYPEIAWAKAMGTRNILIHQYFGIDLEIVWDTVSKDLPVLKKQIRSLLEDLK